MITAVDRLLTAAERKLKAGDAPAATRLCLKAIAAADPIAYGIDFNDLITSISRIVPEDTSLSRGTKRLLGQVGDVSAYLVDPSEVMIKLSMEFTLGGNGYVYDFIPKDEVWVNAGLSPAETRYTIYHECIERYLMMTHGKTYDDAHQIANVFERAARNEKKFG